MARFGARLQSKAQHEYKGAHWPQEHGQGQQQGDRLHKGWGCSLEARSVYCSMRGKPLH